MRFTDGGVTAAKGFKVSSAAAGIKYAGRDDMALILSEEMCSCAGVFTRNIVKAAPVKWDMDIVKNTGKAQAIVCNSGIANACTGEQGFEICAQTAVALSGELDIPEDAVLIASTGVIGMQIDIERIKKGVKLLSGNLGDDIVSAEKAARAIMTTDTVPKQVAVSFNLGDKEVHIGGMCKGSGMIHPDMCTMLCFICTDADIDGSLLQEALSEDIADSFNMISVDGDTSTNDTVLLLANGAAGNTSISSKNDDYRTFKEALSMVTHELCKMIAGDGEGATALFEARVEGAKTKEQARILSKAIVCSNLVKTAICGHDANWGRIICAMGYSGADFDPEIVDLFFESKAGKIQIMKNGIAADYSEEDASSILSEPEVRAIARLGQGQESAVAWGCDLTKEYVAINADYRS